MAVQQNNNKKPEFERSLRGYSVEQVDEYVRKLTENYAALYREKAELEMKLAESEARFADIDAEIADVKTMKAEAQRVSDAIVSEAYKNADNILATVRKNCEASIAVFRKRVSDYQSTLASMKQQVKSFRSELFEKYRLHVELINQLHPTDDPNEAEYTAGQYAEKVVTTLKREIVAEYGLTIDDVQPPHADTQAEPQVQSITTPDGEGFIHVGTIPNAGTATSKMTKLIDEYRKDALADVPAGVQLELDIDAGTVKVGDGK